jgi:hypothetical protein
MAGIARVVVWVLHGAPSPARIGITCADLLLPPLLYFQAASARPSSNTGSRS